MEDGQVVEKLEDVEPEMVVSIFILWLHIDIEMLLDLLRCLQFLQRLRWHAPCGQTCRHYPKKYRIPCWYSTVFNISGIRSVDWHVWCLSK
jgi:hypothetical protein